MADSRTSRDLSSRDKSARIVYTPSSTLPDPTPEPGYTYRWIGTHILGQSNPTNVSAKLRDGWVPVKAVDHEELMLVGNEKTGNVEIGGLMLCKMPTERAQAISDYYHNAAQANMESVDNNFMRQQDPRMATLFAERKSTTTRGNFGSGSK